MMYIDNEVLEKMIMTMVEGFNRLEKKLDRMNRLKDCLDGDTLLDNCEGIRVSFDRDNGDGWFLLRLSVHDPIMPLNVESDSEGGVKIICDKLGKFLKTTTGLDL